MNRNILVFGLIAGAISSVWTLIFPLLEKSSFDYDHGMLYGYLTMIIAFSMIFVGIKNYRDKYNNGIIKFGKAFTIGLYITLIASTIYVVTWLINYYFFVPDFFETMANSYVNKLKAEGASEAAIQAKMAEMASFKEYYKNPLFNAAITYCEILPAGLIMSLIAAAVLKRTQQPTTI